jgi:hypothetical protein
MVVSGDLNSELEQYVDAACPRFSSYGRNLSFQLNFWTPTTKGTATAGGQSFDLGSDLGLGSPHSDLTRFGVPALAMTAGGIFVSGINDWTADGFGRGVAVGALIGILATSSPSSGAIEFVTQYNWRQFGVRYDALNLNLESDEPPSAGGSEFAVIQHRVMAMWTFHRSCDLVDPAPESNADSRGIAFSILVGALWAQTEIAVGPSITGEASAILPQIGVLLEGRHGKLGFDAQLTGGALDRNTWVDGRISASFMFNQGFGIRVGYRYVQAEIGDDNNGWSGSMDGFFFGANFNF